MATRIEHTGDEERIQHQPATDEGAAYPAQTMAQERPDTASIGQKGGEKPGDHEKSRHPETMDEDDQPAEEITRLRVLIRPVRPVGKKGQVVDRSMQD